MRMIGLGLSLALRTFFVIQVKLIKYHQKGTGLGFRGLVTDVLPSRLLQDGTLDNLFKIRLKPGFDT